MLQVMMLAQRTIVCSDQYPDIPFAVRLTNVVWIRILCKRVLLGVRNKFVPFKEFSASFAFTAALVVWLMWGIVWIVIASFFIGWWALSVPYVMAFLQTYAYHFKDYLNEWISLFQYRKVNNKAELSRLRSEIECLNL